MPNQTGQGLRTERNPKHQKFFDLFCETQDYVYSYRAAGYIAESDKTARANACRLMRKLDKKLDYRAIMDSVGLTDRHVAEKIREIVDDKEDKHVAVKGLNLATRCKGWQQPNINVGIGMQIVITNQSAVQSNDSSNDDDTIDVTEISQAPPDDEMIQD